MNAAHAKLERPLIIIGAGRSGSSLLHELLCAHPHIHMLGEMAFAPSLLWQALWDVSAAVNPRSVQMERVRRRAEAEKNVTDAAIIAAVRGAEENERCRVAGIGRRALDELYHLSERPEALWGFKEIWMGSEGPHTWSPYDALFPQATYVHIIRHPYHYARSVADWNRIPFNLPFLREQLAAWIDYLAANRARSATERYVAIRYESLVRDPKATLSPLLTRLGLAWDDACLVAAERKHVASLQRSGFPVGARALAESIPQLPALMLRLDYDLSKIVEDDAGAAAPVEVATRLNDSAWRLNPPFAADGEHGWLSTLRFESALEPLAEVADDLQHARRSPLRFFENDVPLGPPHALHATIRSAGGGRYSHWGLGHVLLFSTSDNSDPNMNGRTYTLQVDAAA